MSKTTVGVPGHEYSENVFDARTMVTDHTGSIYVRFELYVGFAPRSVWMGGGARKECATSGGGTKRSTTKGASLRVGVCEISVTSFTSIALRVWRQVAIGRSTGVRDIAYTRT